MSWEVVPEAEVPKVIDACKDGRCVSCYGAISRQCPNEHGFYCCGCDDYDDCSPPTVVEVDEVTARLLGMES